MSHPPSAGLSPPAPSLAKAAAPGALHVLAVGGDPAAIQTLCEWAVDLGTHFEHAPDLPRAARTLSAGTTHWDVVLAVLAEQPEEELSWWVEALRTTPGSPRLIGLANRPSMGLVLRAEELGVVDLLSLPPRRDQFQNALSRVRAATTELPIPLPPVEAHAVGPYALVGQSPAMLEVYKLIARVGPSVATVVIQGESGTGKEVVARAIHQNGPKATGPFVAVNCAAIPENLLESELFGHEKGAFTGAVIRKIGRFEQANHGTLFLDEIGDMSLALQSKILRAIQEREIERVGGGESIPVDVRLIAATNRDLRTAISDGRFREDLYYRLAVVTINLPRLAERGDDLVLLTSHFAKEFGGRSGKAIRRISDRMLELLRGHRWAGNVRELRNVIERAVIVATDDTLRAEHLPDEFRGPTEATPEPVTGGLATLADVEARHIARVLSHTGGQIGSAADILGIHRNTLARKIKEYGL